MRSLILSLLGVALATSVSAAEIEKKTYNYSDWTKGLFGEAVTITGIGEATFIFLGGIGAEDEAGPGGNIRGTGNIKAQCEYSFDKIKRVLERNKAGMKDIVKMTSFLTSTDYIVPYSMCKKAFFEAEGAQLPAETLVIISKLAWPDMLMYVAVNAIASTK